MDVLAVSENAGHEQNTDVEKPKKPEEETKFQKAILAWRSIDLANLVSKLDAAASDVVAHQRDSLVQRKDLAQKTKDFRKLDDSSKLTEYKGLLKSYQAFIDLLTTHGKASSSAFLQLYSALSEAPDPYPLLEASIDSLVLSEDTVPKLTSERDSLKKTVARLTSQLEQSEKRVEEERALRRKLEDEEEKKIQGIESSWNAVIAEKTSNWEAKERSYEEKAENHERLIKEIKATYEVSQRLDSQDGVDAQRSAATAAELEIVAADLEKTSTRLAEVEARNEQLRLDLAQAMSRQGEQKQRSIEEEPAYLRLQTENSSLLRKLEAARDDRNVDKSASEGKLRQAERQNTRLVAERDELRVKLEKVADYEDIRRELEIIKSIEFSTGNDDDADLHDQPADETSTGKENELEQLLISRNKKLSNELTLLRVSHHDLEAQLEALREELSKTNAELERSRKLTTSLENDLLQVQKETTQSSAMSVAGTLHNARYPYSARRGRTSPTSSIISGFDHSVTPMSTMEAIRSGEPLGGGSGILPMVQAQRDRFKQKNAELEEELSKTYATVKGLRQEIASLQKDNLNLYEKTRYISTYHRNSQNASSSSATPFSNQPHSTSIQIDSDGSSGLGLDKYSSAYEAQISPFAAFRGRESTRAYKRMSVPERMIFSITRMVLANRTSRNLFAAYCLALHVLVFVLLYMMSTVDVTKHGANLGSMAGAAAAQQGTGRTAAGSADWQQEGLQVE